MFSDPEAGRVYLGRNWTPELEEAAEALLSARITLGVIEQAAAWVLPDEPPYHALWRALKEAQREEKRRAFLWRDRGGQPGWEPGA